MRSPPTAAADSEHLRTLLRACLRASGRECPGEADMPEPWLASAGCERAAHRMRACSQLRHGFHAREHLASRRADETDGKRSYRRRSSR
jgi:hypothetical protein